MKNWTVGIVSIAMLAGCVGIASSELSGNATLMLLPKISDGSYMTKADVHKYVSADIDHLNLYLKTGGINGTTKATKVVPIANVGNAVVFNNLRNNIVYTVLAEAISTASAIISDNASSSMTITVGTDNTPQMFTIPVGLINSPFNGGGTTGITVTNGSYTYSGTETIATASPTPTP